MRTVRIVGGPHDGRVLLVPDHVDTVSFPELPLSVLWAAVEPVHRRRWWHLRRPRPAPRPAPSDALKAQSVPIRSCRLELTADGWVIRW